MDSWSFKQGMRLLCGGVTIVTTRNEETMAGLTATAVCSLSAEPPRLLACINRAGMTYRTIAESRIFCVNVLAAEQKELALSFAGMTAGNGDRRFDPGSWDALHTGAPVLAHSLAAFDCSVLSILDSGSHAIIIGDVKDVRTQSGLPPLLYMDGTFMTAMAVEEQGSERTASRA